MKDYIAGGDAFLYPEIGDKSPSIGCKVLLLTKGGVCIVGHWKANDPFILGWAPLPLRDKEKEKRL